MSDESKDIPLGNAVKLLRLYRTVSYNLAKSKTKDAQLSTIYEFLNMMLLRQMTGKEIGKEDMAIVTRKLWYEDENNDLDKAAIKEDEEWIQQHRDKFGGGS
jgi:hypothetical protein